MHRGNARRAIRSAGGSIMALVCAAALLSPLRATAQDIYQTPAAPYTPQAVGAGAPLDDDAIGLQLARARARLGLGDSAGAHAEVEAVLSAAPDNVEAQRVLGTIYEAEGRWRRAARLWGDLSQRTGDAPARQRFDALRHAHPNEALIAGFQEGSSADSLYGVQAEAHFRPLDGPEWSLSIEHRLAEADAVTFLNGAVNQFDDSATRVDLGVADTFGFGKLSGALTLAEEDAGARVEYSRSRSAYSFELLATYNQPYWVYSAGIANGATRHSVGGGLSLWSGRAHARAFARANQFDVADEEDVGRSIVAAAALEYALSGAANPIRVSYIVETESFSSIETRIGPSGPYQALPFLDRTVHSLGAYKVFDFSASGALTLGAGYRADTENDAEGPYAHFSGEAPLGERTTLGARFEYSEASPRGEQTDAYSAFRIAVRRRL